MSPSSVCVYRTEGTEGAGRMKDTQVHLGVHRVVIPQRTEEEQYSGSEKLVKLELN